MQSVLSRGVLAAAALVEASVSLAFYFRPEVAFAILGRPLLDAVISRQYGLFLSSVALFYALIATNPAKYRRFIWIGVIQRAVELVVASLDWRAAALSPHAFALVAAGEVAGGAALAFCAFGAEPAPKEAAPKKRADVWLVRALLAFGGLQLFWTLLSTVAVQFGARLLGWKLQDAYTTQQQGIALLVIGLTSVLAASDVKRYRLFVLVAVSSQAFGVINAINEYRLGTIPATVAFIQWAIEASIIAVLL
ncbi:MAG: hypothetical protein IAI50_03095, partial [Candidatus Eremiobacteraeota bacterium]|nr:hypothetical protein [Candidatus Eremiobacteraeota bacterium]